MAVLNFLNETTSDSRYATASNLSTHTGTATIHFTEASIDHGSIAGLGDDDHTQYSLADGSRAFTGTVSGVSPTSGAHLATKDYADSLLNGLGWQDPISDIQTDGTLDPTASPATGVRYIVTNTGALHANFGTITGVGNNDIVEYDGANFIVKWDASVEGEGAAVWSLADDKQYTYNGSSWVAFGSTVNHNALLNLTSGDDHTQYALLAGRSGGQNLGLGVETSPSYALHTKGTGSTQTVLASEHNSGPIAFLEASSAQGNMGTLGVYPLKLVTNGTERINISSTGQVGIGVAPGAIKFVVSTGAAATLMRLTDGLQQSFDISSDAGAGLAGTVSMDTVNTGALSLKTGSVERLRIASTAVTMSEHLDGLSYNFSAPQGQIGTLTDTSTVAGGIGGKIFFGGTYTGSSSTTFASIGAAKDNGVDGQFGGSLVMSYRLNGGALLEGARLDGVGNFGIGVTPTAKLELGGTSNIRFVTTAAAVFVQTDGDDLTFGTRSADHMTILAGGNVGIGTTNPLTDLEIILGASNTTGDTLSTSVSRIVGVDLAPASNAGNLTIATNNTLGSDIGGSIAFGGRYLGTDEAHWAIIKSGKDNSTSGEYGGYLSFYSRTHGSLVAERIRIKANGDIDFNNNALLKYKDLVKTTNSGSAYTVDLDLGSEHDVTLTANTTITMPTVVSGKSFTVLFIQNASSAYTVAYSGSIKWAGGTAHTMTTTLSKIDIVTFVAHGSSWLGLVSSQEH